jgi:geranylgeranyl diphosphate synthase, type II
MDDALERRGFPTVHSIYSQDSAILAALALINRAYSLIWTAMQDCDISARTLASDYLDRQLGVSGILGGQSRDVHMKYQSSAAEVIRVSYGKTVSLVKLTLVLPAVIAGADEVRELERLSTYWGLAYQVSDDLKDEYLSAQIVGKTVKQDAVKGRPNIAVAEGYERAARRMKHYVAKGDEVLSRLVAKRSEWIFLSTLRKRFEGEVTYWKQENEVKLTMTGTE